MQLDKWQKEFCGAIFSEGEKPVSDLKGSSQVSAERRFSVYRRNVVGTLVHTLQEIFPTCQTILGEECFKAAAYEFLCAVPSDFPDLNRFGVSFPVFLFEHRELRDVPYVGDVAFIEWCRHESEHAADDFPADMRVVERAFATDPDSLTIRLPKHLYLSESSFPLMRIWEFNQLTCGEREGKTLDAGEQVEKNRLVIWRPEYQVAMAQEVNDERWKLLKGLFAGKDLGELVESIYSEENINQLSTDLFSMLRKGWLVV